MLGRYAHKEINGDQQWNECNILCLASSTTKLPCPCRVTPLGQYYTYTYTYTYTYLLEAEAGLFWIADPQLNGLAWLGWKGDLPQYAEAEHQGGLRSWKKSGRWRSAHGMIPQVWRRIEGVDGGG